MTVSAVVKNTGARAGFAVPQLYVGMPEPVEGVTQPPFQLKGFAKVRLAPGASRRVTFTLDDRAFSWWAGSGWEVAVGCYRIGVGEHSRDLALKGDRRARDVGVRRAARAARCEAVLVAAGVHDPVAAGDAQRPGDGGRSARAGASVRAGA